MHLDGLEEHHDKAVNQPGTFKRAVAAIKAGAGRGLPGQRQLHALQHHEGRGRRPLSSTSALTELDVEGVTAAPGYAYERAPEQRHFLNRTRTKQLFRDILKLRGKTKWRFSQSALYMDFLAGNQTYQCTPWGTPTRNIFGWQRPCYLLGEGYARRPSRELMETTEWDRYGTGNYEKCADCMVHCGYEGTAVEDTLAPAVEGADGQAARLPHRRRRWRPRFRSRTSGRPSSSSRAW